MCLRVGGLTPGSVQKAGEPHQLQIISWLSVTWQVGGPVSPISLISYLWSSALPHKASGELETSGSFLGLKAKQTNSKKKGSHGYVLARCALNSPAHEHAGRRGWDRRLLSLTELPNSPPPTRPPVRSEPLEVFWVLEADIGSSRR